VQEKEIKQSLFADDATFFNNGFLKSIENLIKTLNDFSKCSDLNLKVKKVTVIKTFAIPKLIYLFTVFENSNIKICNNLTTEIFKFIGIINQTKQEGPEGPGSLT